MFVMTNGFTQEELRLIRSSLLLGKEASSKQGIFSTTRHDELIERIGKMLRTEESVRGNFDKTTFSRSSRGGEDDIRFSGR